MQADPILDEEPDFKPKSKWPLIVFLLVLVGGAGFLAYRAMTAVEPLRVLVAVRFDDGFWFDGSPASAAMTDEINQQLATLGFEPVKPGDPEVMALLEDVDGDLETARAKLNAAYLISGQVTPKVVEHPVDDGYFEVRAEGHVQLTGHDGGEPFVAKVSGWSGAKDKDRAIKLMASGSIPELAAAELIPALLAHPTIAELLEGDATTVGKLAPAAKFAKVRAQRLSSINESYPAHAKRRQAKEKGPVPVTYFGDTSKEDGLCGAGPDGYLVKTEDSKLFISPRDNRDRRVSAMESVEFRQPGGAAKVLWQGYNLPSYPTVSADGRTVALCEDIFGWAKTVTIVGAEGPKRLRIDPKKRFSGFELSNDGSHIALYERPCRKCKSEVVVLSTTGDGTELFRMARHGGRFDGMVWLGPSTLGLLYNPPAPPPDEGGEGDEEEVEQDLPPEGWRAERATFYVLDFAGDAQPKPLYTVAENEFLEWPDASPNGKSVAFAALRAGQRGILVLNTTDGTTKAISVDGRSVSAPDIRDDGRITFNFKPAGTRDEEVAVWDGQAVRQLTDNPFRDRYPKFSADGKSIFFESLDKDPQAPRRHVSVIASVPAE